MKQKFKIGDYVKCINASRHAMNGNIGLQLNKRYRISYINKRFNNLALDNTLYNWSSDRFNKIIDFKTKIKFIKELL